MKLKYIFLLTILLTVSAKLQAQLITISAQKAPIEKVIADIQKQSGYEFLYSSKLIKNAKPVDINVKDAHIEEALIACFKDQPFSYSIIGKTVVLKAGKDAKDKSITGSAKIKNPESPVIINGKVLDEDGHVLPGVTITVKGHTFGTTTDQLGNFLLPVPDNSSGTLVFSFVGYESQEYNTKNTESISIVLKKQVKGVDEVVVVGMSTQKKKYVTSAVSTVTAKDLENLPYTNIYESLNGRVPGLAITRDYSPGGQNSNMLIRGKSTGIERFSSTGNNIGNSIPQNTNNFGFGNNQPLVLIDGFEGNMGLLNPQDIESVTILKDASAAIYGIRAANGVVLITTKTGELNSLKVQYDFFAGFQSFARRPKYLSSWQQATLVNETIDNETVPGTGGFGNGGIGFGGGGARLTKYTPEEIQKFKDGSDPVNYPNTNWEDRILKLPAFQQRHNLSISGGDKRSKYLFSAEYFQQQGNVPKTKNERYNARFNMSSKLSEKLIFKGGLSFSQEPVIQPVTGGGGFGSGGNGNLLTVMNSFSPTLPLKWANDQYSNNGLFINPLAWLETPSSYKASSSIMSGNLELNWRPLKGLSLRPSLGYSNSQNDSKIFVSELVAYANGTKGAPLTPLPFVSNYTSTLDESSGRSYALITQMIAEYEKVFGNHEIGLMAGGLRSYAYNNYLNAHKEGLLNSGIQAISIAPLLGQQVSGSELESAQQSVFGRLRYNYNDIFIFESTLRADGTTAFAPKYRYKVFPAFSAGWIMSNQSFFKDATGLSNTISFLKLRGSWGILGNSSVGYFTYLRRLKTGNYSFNNQSQSAVYPTDGYNPDLEPEQTRVIDLGLDAVLFKEKLSVTLDLYHKQTNGLIMAQQVPANYGLGTTYENVGSLYNKGVELEVKYHNRIGAFLWSVAANGSYNKNKVLKFRNKTPSENLGLANDIVEGEDIYAIWGLRSNGIYQKQSEVTGSPVLNNTVGPGDIRYIDVNKDGKIDGADRVKLGSYYAPMRFGFTLESQWKNFGLRLFFRGESGRSVFMSSALGYVANQSSKVVSDYWDRWTPENPTSKFPRSWNNFQQNDPTNTVSDFWLRKANYLKLDNITFSYNLPGRVCKRIGMTSVRMYYSGQNLFTIAPHFWSWLDPETTRLQANSGSYPSVRMQSFGISVGL